MGRNVIHLFSRDIFPPLSFWRWASGPVVSGSPLLCSSANSSLITVTQVSTLVIFNFPPLHHRLSNNPFDSRTYKVRYVKCWVQSHTRQTFRVLKLRANRGILIRAVTNGYTPLKDALRARKWKREIEKARINNATVLLLLLRQLFYLNIVHSQIVFSLLGYCRHRWDSDHRFVSPLNQ